MKYASFFLLIALALAACGKKEVPPPPVAEKAADPVPTVDEALTAMLRSHPHSLRICFNAGRYEGYLLEYPQATDGKPDEDLHGWYMVQEYKFFYLDNKTWFTNTVEYDKWIVIHPDVTGLTCKVHGEPPRTVP